MGRAPATTAAGLYLKPLDWVIFSCNLTCYFPYLDDLFLIWSNHDTAQQVQKQALRWKRNTLVERQSDSKKGTFLNVMVFKLSVTLLHCIYVTPTCSRSLLHAFSFHPCNTREASFTSSFFRYLWLCYHS